jgi:hypothetical protein
MTTAATIRSRIDKGNAIAARQLGIAYSLYRPAGTGNPLASGNLRTTLPALFSQETTFTKLPKPNRTSTTATSTARRRK